MDRQDLKDRRDLYRAKSLARSREQRIQREAPEERVAMPSSSPSSKRYGYEERADEGDVISSQVLSPRVAMQSIAEGPREVSLIDLLKTAKHKAARPAHDFELIARPQKVIALDDEPDLLDGEWEKVDMEADARPARSRPSYAAVLKA